MHVSWSASRQRPVSTFALLATVVLALTGCSGPLAQPAGKVLWKNQPVPGAELAFYPENNPEDLYSGISGEDGSYHVGYRGKSGLPVGRYRVVVTRYTLPNGKPLPSGEEGAALRGEERAVRHSYVFEKDIAAGANAIDFELTEGKKQQVQPEE